MQQIKWGTKKVSKEGRKGEGEEQQKIRGQENK